MIGDTPYDIEAAQARGHPSDRAALRRLLDRHSPAGALEIFDDPGALLWYRRSRGDY